LVKGTSINAEFAPATAPALLLIRCALDIRVGAGFAPGRGFAREWTFRRPGGRKCKARKKFRRAHMLICKQEIFSATQQLG